MTRQSNLFFGMILAGATLFAPSATLAQQTGNAAASAVREGFQSASEQTFDESFPQGKLSVVERQVAGTGALLTTAHKLALRGDKQRDEYREALVYQAAARRALDDASYVEAMYLTLHARSLGRGVIRANTTRIAVNYQPDDLELIKRAGGVETSKVEDYLEAAQDDVPELRWLFVEAGEQDERGEGFAPLTRRGQSIQ